MSRSIPLPYSPYPVPTETDDIPRYLASELDRIAQRFIAQPVAFTVKETTSITATTAINWQRIYVGEAPSWDIPGGGWDSVLGEWTCPQNGLYQISSDSRVSPFGAGNKTYYAGVALIVVKPDLTTTRIEMFDGGDDAVPLGVTLATQLPLEQGDVLYSELTVVHDQFVGVVEVISSLQLLRVSG